MTEIDTRPTQVLPEVGVMRRWVEEDVIGNGFCPPLNILAREHRAIDGSLRWETLGREVDIVSLHHIKLDDPTFQDQVSGAYLRFIAETITSERAPISRILVLPDLQCDLDLTSTVDSAVKFAKTQLATTEEGQSLVDQLVYADPQLVGFLQFLHYPSLAEEIVDGAYKPIPFFGMHANMADSNNLAKPEVDDRAKILSRAPYHALQLIDKIRVDEQTGHINFDYLHERNTNRAAKIGIPAYEARMTRLRQGLH